jgi:hypothetical protein
VCRRVRPAQRPTKASQDPLICLWDDLTMSMLRVAKFAGGLGFAEVSVASAIAENAYNEADGVEALRRGIADAGLPPAVAITASAEEIGDEVGPKLTAEWQTPTCWGDALDCLNWQQQCRTACFQYRPQCCGLPMEFLYRANWWGVGATCYGCGHHYWWSQPSVGHGPITAEWQDRGVRSDLLDVDRRRVLGERLSLDSSEEADLIWWPRPVNRRNRTTRPRRGYRDWMP